MKLYKTKTIREISGQHEFRHSRSLGQNFLTDKNIRDRIIEASDISSEDLVIEIGPGMGVLTQEAAERAGKVVAIEIDRSLIPVLEHTLSEYSNIEIINEDVLRCSFRNIIERERPSGKVRIIGNLPYYITTPIIMKILKEDVPADSMTVMMQDEVAQRIEAAPGSRTYGALSLAVQYSCRVTHIISVPRDAFVPKPKVDSAVLRLDIKERKSVDVKDERMFFACIRAGFGQRRKTLLNSLSGIGMFDREIIRKVLTEAGIDPVRRAETLTMEEFASIADKLSEEQKNI